ncbi:Bax inhibitor-1/YccA family protein [Streptomyces sp. NPDC087843]|uniref:Bax inhibitor-1/YccA family membrane protein n=1 Tax=Streptomyces sp. NPDC087843 TaxID=3365804 RepID=UPI00380A4BAE
MKSSNPVLLGRRWIRQGGSKTAVGDPLVGVTVARHLIVAGHDPDRKSEPESPGLPHLVADLMTMKGVLARTLLAFAVTVLMTVLSWTVPPVSPTSLDSSYGLAGGAGMAAAALVLVQCRRGRPSPVLTLAHAVAEGVFLGVLSNTASTHISPGVFVQLVLGTIAAFASVLMAYALGWIQVAQRWYGFLCSAAMGLVLLMVGDVLLLPFLGAASLGFRSAAVGVLCGVTGVGLAIPLLAVHFKQVEDGITHGALRQESWMAAFGLNLTLVWLYVETLRLTVLVPAEDICRAYGRAVPPGPTTELS